MKKIITLVVLIAICSISFATEARMEALGVNPIYYNDDAIIGLFPHYLPQYMNMAYIDGYYYSYYKCMDKFSGGLNMRLAGKNVGIYINKDFPIRFDYSIDKTESARLDKALNLYYATDDFGFGLDLAMDKYKNDATKQEQSTFGIGGKIGTTLDGIDLGGQVYFASGKDKNSTEIKNSAFMVGLAARKKMFETKKSCVYPAIEFEFYTEKETIEGTTKTDNQTEYTDTSFEIFPGIGFNHWLTKEVMVIGAATVGFNSCKEETKYTYKDTTYSHDKTTFTLPKLELGLEAYPAKWLTLRAGINKSYLYKIEPIDDYKSDDKVYYYDSYFSYSFGVGLHFGRFIIDWEICDDLLWNAPYIISGMTSEFASTLSLKYVFGN